MMAMLSGCVLPPAVSVATLALDVGSFAVSGKTVTDHGLSLVAQEDCALTRVLEGEICEAYLEYEVADDVLQPLPPEDFGLVAGRSETTFYSEVDYSDTGDGAASSKATIFQAPLQIAQSEVIYSFTTVDSAAPEPGAMTTESTRTLSFAAEGAGAEKQSPK